MLKYGLDSFVEGAISSKKRSFDPKIRQIVQAFLGTTGNNEEDNVNMSNGVSGREYSSHDRYNSYHHSYGRDRDNYYYSSHSRRSDHDSNSQMEYDVDNTEQDMEVDDDSSQSSTTSSSQSEEGTTETNALDSSVQARLDSFLQTFKEVSKQQQQRKQIKSRQESAANTDDSSSDSHDIISKLTSGAVTRPLAAKPTFKFNLNLVKNEPGASNYNINTQSNVQNRISPISEEKDDFSTQDMKLDEVSPNSDLPLVRSPQQGDSNEKTESKVTNDIKEGTSNASPPHDSSANLQEKPNLPLSAPVTLPPAHLLTDSQIGIDEDDFDDDDLSNSPKAPTPEPISPGPIDVNFEEEAPPSPAVKNESNIKNETVSIGEKSLNQTPVTKVIIDSEKLTNSEHIGENLTKLPSATLPQATDAIPIPLQNTTDSLIPSHNTDAANSDSIKVNVSNVKVEKETNKPVQTKTKTNDETKQEPKNSQKNPVPIKNPASKAPSQKTGGNTKNKPLIKKEPIVLPNIPSVSLEEILSDVSSVHTSDLSDFDDRISISSSEELSLYKASGEMQEPISLSVTLNSTAAPTAASSSSGRRKISLQEVKQQLQAGERVTSASSSIASSSGSVSQGGKGKRSKKANVNIPCQAQGTNKQTVSGKGRRERKINPKYASDEYSSIYNRKKSGISQSLMEEEIDSDEDFDMQSLGEVSNKETVNSPSISVENTETTAKEPENESESTATVTASATTGGGEEDEETSNSITSPMDCLSDTSTSTTATSANVRKFRKKVQQRQVRYDASDLYKPRTSLGSSRRSRNVNNDL